LVPLNADPWSTTVTEHLYPGALHDKTQRSAADSRGIGDWQHELDRFLQSELSSSILAISPPEMM